ncbi:hypothetical protein [Liquorilactobacillus hordei]|uniref:hypothetical protein n=1 Tax=Liquorilactobacillus hordei TaxID=468911 RepID=UPI001CBDC674|nr:hypothetical protein [Liquorilactobacillus hordei]MBZ2406624.1 hypothetical protein [Liquorilactobacillus hordei]
MSLNDLAFNSNEKRLQRIMKLRRDFNEKKVVTVKSASAATGYAYSTIVKWCKDGDIPLVDIEGKTVVPMTDKNTPRWLK